MKTARGPLVLFAVLCLAFPLLAAAWQAPLAVEVAPQTGEAEKGAVTPWALAIHGGAGTIPKDLPAQERDQYLASLRAALELGRDMLAKGSSSLDTVEAVVRFLEDDPLFNAGKGAVFTHDGKHELDAAIMDGRDLSCGAVAGLKTVRHPISLARLVKESSPHVFLVGDGAEAFATEMKVERVPNEWFDTPNRRAQLDAALRQEAEAKPKGTVGAVALDQQGNLAAATSTGGMTNKRWGRLGDVPVIGAGTYANNRTCAISATGWGEKFIRHTVAHDISALMEYAGLTLQQAADRVIHEKLEKDDGGVIGVARDGSIALVFNSAGMYRGAADSKGRFDVKIWE